MRLAYRAGGSEGGGIIRIFAMPKGLMVSTSTRYKFKKECEAIPRDDNSKRNSSEMDIPYCASLDNYIQHRGS